MEKFHVPHRGRVATRPYEYPIAFKLLRISVAEHAEFYERVKSYLEESEILIGLSI